MEDCNHDGDFETITAVVSGKMPDGMPRWIMTAELCCKQCGIKFRFAGLTPGVFIDLPGCDSSSHAAHLPVYPENMELPFSEHVRSESDDGKGD